MIAMKLNEKLEFVYGDKVRIGYVERLKGEGDKQVATILTTEGYRSFTVAKMSNVVAAE